MITGPSCLPSHLDASFEQALQHGGVPDHLHAGLLAYLRCGIPPGSCLQAILQNDLKTACFKCDPLTELALRPIILFLANYAPYDSWGSVEHYDAWIADGAERRRQATQPMVPPQVTP